jgi:hypothetical protein
VSRQAFGRKTMKALGLVPALALGAALLAAPVAEARDGGRRAAQHHGSYGRGGSYHGRSYRGGSYYGRSYRAPVHRYYGYGRYYRPSPYYYSGGYYAVPYAAPGYYGGYAAPYPAPVYGGYAYGYYPPPPARYCPPRIGFGIYLRF